MMGFAAFFGTLTGKIVIGAVALVGGLGLTAGGLYANDFPLEATVIDKSCSPLSGYTVTVELDLFGIDSKQPVGADECVLVQKGNFVKYNVKSERLRLYESEGGCLIYDSHGDPTCPQNTPGGGNPGIGGFFG